MIRLLRKIIRALAGLPFLVKLSVGLAVLLEFLIIAGWDELNFRHLPPPTSPPVTASPAKSDQHAFDFPNLPPADKAQAAAIEATVAKRMDRLVIEDPVAQPHGEITGNHQTVFLYGIKPFDSKAVCTHASGERWACGLQAYATLRNSIAKKTIVCDPKLLLPNGVTAICHLGSIDIALTLVRDGLVEIDNKVDDAEMAKAQAFAKSQKLGIWDR